jgi:PBSX family phage terminase large subunit
MIVLNPKYKKLFTTDKRYIIITGGRGSGKSFHITSAMNLLTDEADHRILFTRYTMTSADISIIPEFKDKIELMGRENDFNVGKSEIVNTRTGSEIWFRGIKTSSGNQTANLKSIADITTWVLDEAEELVDEKIFNKINLSIRTQKAQNRVILILNPTSYNHWIYKKFFAKHLAYIEIEGEKIETTTHPEVCHIHSTYLDNIHNLSETFLKEVEELKEEDYAEYCHSVLGKWRGKVEGALFEEEKFTYFKKEDMPKTKSDAVLGYIDIADEGDDYLCAVFAKIWDKKIYIEDVIFSQDNIDITLPQVSTMVNALNVDYVRVEGNNQGGGFIRLLRQTVQEDKVLMVKNTQNKHTRIKLSYSIIKNKLLFLHPSQQSHEYKEMMKQMFEYKKDGTSKHDDAPDAMAGLANFIQALLPHIFE